MPRMLRPTTASKRPSAYLASGLGITPPRLCLGEGAAPGVRRRVDDRRVVPFPGAAIGNGAARDAAPTWSSQKLSLFQLVRHLVDAGLGASFVLVAARRPGNPDGADGVLADLDRQCALRRGDVGET